VSGHSKDVLCDPDWNGLQSEGPSEAGCTSHDDQQRRGRDRRVDGYSFEICPFHRLFYEEFHHKGINARAHDRLVGGEHARKEFQSSPETLVL
jgi:hypothetical protein